MRTGVPQTFFVLGLVLLAAGCGGGDSTPPATFADAKALAAGRGVPLLLDFFTDW